MTAEEEAADLWTMMDPAVKAALLAIPDVTAGVLHAQAQHIAAAAAVHAAAHPPRAVTPGRVRAQ